MLNLCDCAYDGWCHRYQKTMTGRFREICQGINCDLGTAAVFRDQWLREINSTVLDLTPKHKPIPLILKTHQAPGDAVVMTAAIYSLHKAHPNKYLTAVEAFNPEVFQYNPNLVDTEYVYSHFSSREIRVVQMHYPAIHDSNIRGIHFMQAYCEFLGNALGIQLPLLTNKPHIYFNTDKPPVSDYWIVCSGGKKDLTNKLWGYENYLQTVEMLEGKIKFIQVGSSHEEHPMLESYNVTDLVGQTNLRELFDLVRKARGVLCGVSLPMHVAAALEKPAIVIAGGREPVQWNAYPKQQYLHTVGTLPCVDPLGIEGGACWRSRLYPLGDNQVLDTNTCLFPDERAQIPKCMTFICPEQVAEQIMRYNGQYEDSKPLDKGRQT